MNQLAGSDVDGEDEEKDEEKDEAKKDDTTEDTLSSEAILRDYKYNLQVTLMSSARALKAGHFQQVGFPTFFQQ